MRLRQIGSPITPRPIKPIDSKPAMINDPSYFALV
jgi:hypothetical protein